MRVIHVIPSIAPRDGGPSVAVGVMARGLGTLGHEVLVVATDADGPGRLGGLTGHPVPHEGTTVLLHRRAFGPHFKVSIPLARWLAAEVRHFDIVHVHAVFSFTSVAAALTCQHARVPFVLRPLGSLDPWSLARRAWAKRGFLAALGPRLLHGAAAVHFTADEERAAAERALGPLPRAVVLPLGVEAPDPPPRRPPVDPDRPHLVALGRLDPKKGLEVLFDALAGLASPPAGLRLTVAGDGNAPYVDALRAQARRLPAWVDVVWTGWLAREAVWPLLASADLLVLPSAQENFAQSVVEAMLVGTPVLVSDRVNIAPVIAEHEAGWVASPDATAFCAGLRLALAAPAERARRGERARDLAATRYSARAAAEALAALYAKVVAGRTV